MTQWGTDLGVMAPVWLDAAARVVNRSFGPGTVGQVGAHRSIPTVRIDGDSAETRARALEFGLPCLSSLSPAKGNQRRGFFRRTGR